jgi:hypothetical protein
MLVSLTFTQLVASMTWVEGLFWGTNLMQFLALVYRNLASQKLCFVSVFVFASEIDDLSGRWGNTVQALAQ